jgi:hypothetical protein
MNLAQALKNLEEAVAEHDAWAYVSQHQPLSRSQVATLELRVIDAARAYVQRVNRRRWGTRGLSSLIEPLWRESCDPEVLRLGHRMLELEADIDRVEQQRRPLVKRLYEAEWLRLYEELCGRTED